MIARQMKERQSENGKHNASNLQNVGSRSIDQLPTKKEKIQIGRIVLEDKNENVHMVDGEIENKAILKGRKGIYLEFLSESEASIAEINTLCFIK